MKPPQTARLACIGITLLACGLGCAGHASTDPLIAPLPAPPPAHSAGVNSIAPAVEPVGMPSDQGKPPVTSDRGAMVSSPPQQPLATATNSLPCAVTNVVRERCGACHGATPAGGAPMSLLTHQDFHKPSVTRPELKVFELSRQRLVDVARPMPPSGALVASELSALDGWLAAGAAAGGVGDEGCSAEPAQPGSTTTPGEDPRLGLIPLEGETCYEFPNHQLEVDGDTTPYVVRTGEYYQQFFFKAPWPEGVVASRFGARFDKVPVLHHWLLLTSKRPLSQAGTHEESPGTQLGEGGNLVAGWAIGGNSFVAPPDVGLELPKPGTLVHTQWHFLNRDADVQDTSTVQVCTVPASTRKHLASTLWLGSEDINLRPGTRADVSGSCTNNSKAPVSIVAFWPHMHTRGRNTRTVVTRKNGVLETTFDKPFLFDHQYYHSLSPQMLLQPGDKITTTCTFQNDTDTTLYFGEASNTEMCYILTIAYPAHALENNAWSLSGVDNICL